MPSPDMSFAVSVFGLVCLMLALPPLIRASSPRVRRAYVAAAVLTPIVCVVGGVGWLAATTSPGHLEAALAGEFPRSPDWSYTPAAGGATVTAVSPE